MDNTVYARAYHGTYRQRAHALKMPLVEMLRQHISWADTEAITDAIWRIGRMAESLDSTDEMARPMVVKTKSGLVFKLHPVLGRVSSDFRLNKDTGNMEMVPFPPDIADADPAEAVRLAKEIGYTQDDSGAWCDPLLGMDKL